MALVQTDFSPIPNFVQINPNNKLTVGSRIGVICKNLQIGTVVFENHILPQSFPVAPMASQLRKRAGPSTTFAIELTEPANIQDNSSASVQNNSNQQQHKHIPTITSRQPPPHKKQYRPYPLITPLNSIKCSPKINQLPPYFSEYPPHNPTPINKYSSIQSNMYPTIPSQNTMHHPKIQKSFIPSPMPSNFPQPTYPTIPSTSFAVPRTNINIQYFNNNYWQWSEEDQKWIKVPPPPPQ
uniref:Uncharacterized protein n=1 Tax=Meloidogyne incognita TaxID=6306 RepID=A0A914NSX1_MELIC